jgi:hypothetical protein
MRRHPEDCGKRNRARSNRDREEESTIKKRHTCGGKRRGNQFFFSAT